MTARTKNCFKPTLEALEDRFLPSTTPVAVPNPTSAFASLDRTLSDVAHQTSVLPGMTGNEFFASQQAQAAMTASMQGHQTAQWGLSVTLLSGGVRPRDGGRIVIGSVHVNNPFYLDPSTGNLKPGYHFEAGYKWTADPIPRNAFHFGAPVGLEQVGYGQFNIVISYADFARIAPAKDQIRPLQLRIEIRDAHGNYDGDQKLGFWIIYSHNALGQNQTGGPSATMTQMEDVDGGKHSAAVADMSLLDQYFVALGNTGHSDGLPVVTSGDWSV